MVKDRTRGRELLDLHEALYREKEAIGSNSLLVALSLTGEEGGAPVCLHPQLLCDWGLANELVRAFERAMCTHRGWPVREIPSLVVG